MTESEELKTLVRHQLANIVWPLRTPKDNASFMLEFATTIRDKFHVTKCMMELEEFSSIRNIALSTLSENSIRDNSSLKALKQYYCQLYSMFARFKDCGAEFSWRDSFSKAGTDGNLEFEMNNIMYNIGAIHSELGSKIERNSESSNKEACSHFSSALWWVTELRDNRSGIKPKEMGHDMLTFYHHVLRAQAQECVLTHSLREGMKPENVAKIAAQVASDYEVATKLAQAPLYTDPLKEIMDGAAVFRNWRATVEFKHKYFLSLTQLLLGIACREDSAKEIGTRIARLKIASQYLEPCKKVMGDTLGHQTTKVVYELIESLVSKKLDKAIRYNDNVYHSSIPNRETLPQAEAKILIAPAAFSITSIADFKDVFGNLITIEAVQANSIYSQKKDDLSRQTRNQVAKQDEELAQMMSTLNIDRRSLRLPPVEEPDELIEMCAELSMNPNIVDDVLTKLEELDDKSEEIQKLLDSAQDMLKKNPNRQFQDELNRFKSTHEEALRTSQTLHKQLYPELQQKIQLMSTTNNPLELVPQTTDAGASDKTVISKLEKLLDKVDEMKQQRTSLMNQLTQSLDQDDVMKYAVTANSEHDLKDVYDKEIQKHNKYLEPLKSNLDLQNEMLDTLEQINAQYGQVKLNHEAQRLAYRKKVDSLKKFYEQFKSTHDGINQGLEYHNKMLELVKKFYAKVQTADDLNDLLN